MDTVPSEPEPPSEPAQPLVYQQWSPIKKIGALVVPLVLLIGCFYSSLNPFVHYLDTGDRVASAQGVHTRPPTQEEIARCHRETADYNQRMKSAWRATHPEQVLPNPRPWPPYQCGPIYEVDTPTNTAPTRPPSSTTPRPTLTSRPTHVDGST